MRRPAAIALIIGIAIFPFFSCDGTPDMAANDPIVVTFDGQGAQIAPAPSSVTVTAPATTVASLPAAPQRAGYAFQGWWTAPESGGEAFTATTEVTESITVYARWTQTTTYPIVVFDSQGAETIANPFYIIVAPPATTTSSLPTPPIRSGYDFAGWWTAPGGAGAEFTASTTVTAGVTVYASWTPIPHFVYFNDNGSESGWMDAQAIMEGQTAALAANAYGRSGFRFGGWATSSDGPAVYQDGAAFTMGTENVTLYPTWTWTGPSNAAELESWPYAELITCDEGGGTVFYREADYYGRYFDHTITAFSLGRYEVTYMLWAAVRQWALQGGRGYVFQNQGLTQGTADGGTPSALYAYCPVVGISARDAMVWCNAYSEMMGLTPCYYADAAFTAPYRSSVDASNPSAVNTTRGSIDYAYVRWTANGFRLPTKGEWMYAASCDAKYRTYDASGGIIHVNNLEFESYAWYQGNSGNALHPVGQKLSNAFCFFAMTGTTSEWADDYSTPIDHTAKTDFCEENPLNTYRLRCGGDYKTPLGQLLTIGSPWSTEPWVANGGLRVSRRP